VQAGIRYTVATGEKLVNETFGPNNIRRRTCGTEQVFAVEIEDGRKKTFSLEENGFVFVAHSGDEAEREARLVREPVLSAHNDYTEWSGPNRVKEIMGDEADSLLQSRFAIIQVWRAINRPIESNPLAIGSIAAGDLLIAERRYPHRVGQTYRLKYRPGHRWFYFPKMRRDEALVFKVYDSEKDGRARFTPHTSFDDPATPPGAPPRQSIEARALAFF
jgi:hypothetical protein